MPRQVNTVVDGIVRLNNTIIPATSWSVDINAYSIASTIDATITTASARGFAALPDLFNLAQTVRPLPIRIDLGLGSNAQPTTHLPLESGYIDEIERDHDPDGRTVTLTGRGSASLFQDVQITAPLLKNQSGAAIIANIVANRAKKSNVKIPFVSTAGTEEFAGKTNNDQTFDQTMRGRTEWDVMQAIAFAYGYRLSEHNGTVYYGPYGTSADPVFKAEFGNPATGLVLYQLGVKQSARRSHNIAVVVRSVGLRGKKGASATYGHASATDGETFNIPVKPGLSGAQLKLKAQQVFNDIARREFLATMTLVPNAALLEAVSKNGANFSIALSGSSLWPSEKLTFEVRQIRFEYQTGRRNGLPLLAHVVAGNLSPIQAGGILD